MTVEWVFLCENVLLREGVIDTIVGIFRPQIAIQAPTFPTGFRCTFACALLTASNADIALAIEVWAGKDRLSVLPITLPGTPSGSVEAKVPLGWIVTEPSTYTITIQANGIRLWTSDIRIVGS